MKNKIKILMLLAITALMFAACEDDDNDMPLLPAEPAVSYIINYGGYTGDKSTITSFDKETGNATNGVFESVNTVAMTSNAQHAVSFNGNNGNFLYVSCWGGDIWGDETLSYIAKINLITNTVEKKIALAGGPEGLAIVNNKLYAALGYKDSVAVMDLGTEDISYIETPAVSSYFLKDNDDNLYLSLVSTYSDPSVNTGLGFINTSNNELTTFQMEGMSSGYVNVLAANDDYSKIYVVNEGANWGDPGAVSVFDVSTKSFESDKFLEIVPGLNGLAYYNEKVFVFVSESTTSNGKTMIYNADGTKDSEFETGISPFMLLTVE